MPLHCSCLPYKILPNFSSENLIQSWGNARVDLNKDVPLQRRRKEKSEDHFSGAEACDEISGAAELNGVLADVALPSQRTSSVLAQRHIALMM